MENVWYSFIFDFLKKAAEKNILIFKYNTYLLNLSTREAFPCKMDVAISAGFFYLVISAFSPALWWPLLRTFSWCPPSSKELLTLVSQFLPLNQMSWENWRSTSRRRRELSLLSLVTIFEIDWQIKIFFLNALTCDEFEFSDWRRFCRLTSKSFFWSGEIFIFSTKEEWKNRCFIFSVLV